MATLTKCWTKSARSCLYSKHISSVSPNAWRSASSSKDSWLWADWMEQVYRLNPGLSDTVSLSRLLNPGNHQFLLYYSFAPTCNRVKTVCSCENVVGTVLYPELRFCRPHLSHFRGRRDVHVKTDFTCKRNISACLYSVDLNHSSITENEQSTNVSSIEI